MASAARASKRVELSFALSREGLGKKIRPTSPNSIPLGGICCQTGVYV
jgi:hypothetical protein